MLQEFKKFAMRGNVVDMAVGIIIGAAFGKIISSFVNDVLVSFWKELTKCNESNPSGGILIYGFTDLSNKIFDILKDVDETLSGINRIENKVIGDRKIIHVFIC